jgi:hypothetical protein
MLGIVRQLHRVAPTDATVLIGGETGTGKEVIARAVHSLSARSSGPFIAINCAAIPENLLESELFGHEKGAFTGAVSRKIGKVEAASGGTLMLDEIGDMPLQLQAKILRFLQQRTVERIGSTQEIPVDVRVVSATHRDLDGMITEGSFRQDLFFRLAEISFALPPLRERGNDVVMIAKALLARHATNRALRFSQDALSALSAWSWPGNIRELENRVRRASIMAEGEATALLVQLLTPAGTTPSDKARLFPMLQTLLERGDSANYAPHVLQDRLPGAGSVAPHLLVNMAMSDRVIPSVATQALARALRVPHVPPVLTDFGLVVTSEDAPISGNVNDGRTTAGLFQFGRGTRAANGPLELADHDIGLTLEGRLQITHFLQTWAETGQPEIIDPYHVLGTPPYMAP